MRHDGTMTSSNGTRSRRGVLGIVAAGLAGLAGCSGGGNGGGGQDAPSFDGWMDNVGNYDGVADRTGQSEVRVSVGAEGNGGNLAFAPPAIRIDTGTTVVWEWTGEGGQHNVVAESGADFESDLVLEGGYTFEYTFESTGTVKYFCSPHRTAGMKGVVVVE